MEQHNYMIPPFWYWQEHWLTVDKLPGVVEEVGHEDPVNHHGSNKWHHGEHQAGPLAKLAKVVPTNIRKLPVWCIHIGWRGKNGWNEQWVFGSLMKSHGYKHVDIKKTKESQQNFQGEEPLITKLLLNDLFNTCSYLNQFYFRYSGPILDELSSYVVEFCSYWNILNLLQLRFAPLAVVFAIATAS